MSLYQFYIKKKTLWQPLKLLCGVIFKKILIIVVPLGTLHLTGPYNMMVS